MILQSEGEEEETRPVTSETQLIPKDSTLAAPTTQPVSLIIKEEEEYVLVLAKEIDRYFFSPIAISALSPICRHLEIVHKHLIGTFPVDHTIFARLQKSLLRVAKIGRFLNSS